LGFREVAKFAEYGYMILVRDQVEIHFFSAQGHKGAKHSDHGCFVRVEDANTLSAEFETLKLDDQGAPSFARAEEKPWGVCELVIVDPDKNLLRMGHISSET
jgi:hypothetical protein